MHHFPTCFQIVLNITNIENIVSNSASLVKEKDRIYVCYLMLQNVGSISNKKPNLEFLFSKFDK